MWAEESSETHGLNFEYIGAGTAAMKAEDAWEARYRCSGVLVGTHCEQTKWLMLGLSACHFPVNRRLGNFQCKQKPPGVLYCMCDTGIFFGVAL